MGRDSLTGLIVLAVSLALLWATLGLERHPMVPVGPGFYPRIVLGLTALMAVILVVRDVLARRRAPPAAAAGPRANLALVLVAFAVFAVYVVALPYAGFRLSTLVFLVAMALVLERPRSAGGWVAIAAMAIVGTLVTYLVFERYLQVLLPRGRWTGF